jgi:hypothetical protein
LSRGRNRETGNWARRNTPIEEEIEYLVEGGEEKTGDHERLAIERGDWPGEW